MAGWQEVQKSGYLRADPRSAICTCVVRLLVYHNPICSQSRGALALLEERGAAFDVVEYLKEPIDRAGLERILDALPDPPADLVRKDGRFAELGLRAEDYTTREAVIALLLRNPELMQRPIVFRERTAIIARPSVKVLELL
jgi:arsenate reductase